jgi:hypothetical protein
MIIIDELSLLSLENLYEIHVKMQHAMQSQQLFGGVHVLLAGDLYQMKVVMNGSNEIPTWPKINIRSSSIALKGKEVWQQLNAFVELVENCRAVSVRGELSSLARFNSHARRADFHDPSVLASINQRVGNSLESILDSINNDQSAKPVCITDTHKKIAAINDFYLKKFISQGSDVHRIIATHHQTRMNVTEPNESILNILYSEKGGQPNSPLMASYIDFTIGTRVRIPSNFAVELGIFNGAMGTVVGFVYEGDQPEYLLKGTPPPTRFSNIPESKRKPPIVLVQIDYLEGSTTHECISGGGLQNVYPFSVVSCFCQELANKKYSREQVPLVKAHGRTSHSVQGMTFFGDVIVDPDNRWFAGLYVSISRATHINKVHLTSPVVACHFLHDPEYRRQVDEEYTRLRNEFPQ